MLIKIKSKSPGAKSVSYIVFSFLLMMTNTCLAAPFDIVPYFGLNPGNILTYRTKPSDGTTWTPGERSEIGSKVNFKGNQALQRKWFNPGATTPYKTEYLNVTATAVCLYGEVTPERETSMNPPVCIPRFMNIGQQFTQATTLSITGVLFPVNVNYVVEILDANSTTVPNGTFDDTIHVESGVIHAQSPGLNESWLAFGTGMVKRSYWYDQDDERDSELTAFSQVAGQPSLNAAVLPYARAVAVGGTATAFATIINSGSVTANDCTIALPGGIPATFGYQTTNAANSLIGFPNTPVAIPPGTAQGFVFGVTPTSTIAASEIALAFDCINSAPALSHLGLNTFILTAATTPPPDMLAIGVTPSNDGVVRVPSSTGTGFFAAAVVNIGVGGAITASVDDGGLGLPLNLEVCETTDKGVTIICGNNLTRTVGNNIKVFYTVYVTGKGQPVAYNPATNRLFLIFKANGTIVGATNVAVMTQ